MHILIVFIVIVYLCIYLPVDDLVEVKNVEGT
jgi:hypothetical protein